jgi:hypothetical protein
VIRNVTSLDLFPTHVEIFDFEDDPELNGALLEVAHTDESARSSITGRSLFLHTAPWVARLRAKFDLALRRYLGEVRPDRKEFSIEAYAFLNYHPSASFTPVHDHLIEADIVAIYYAKLERIPRRSAGDYYALDPGVLVLHDPRLDASLDRRGPTHRDHYVIYPEPNRMVLHPAHLRHSVAAGLPGERLAVTCTVAVNRSELFEGCVRYEL